MSEFKRKIYFKVKDFLDHSEEKVCFLIGPRKIGKTYCLQQLYQEYPDALYADFSIADKVDGYVDELYDLLRELKEVICFIDEANYMPGIDGWLGWLGQLVCGTDKCSFKIVITGSQPVALEYWAGRYFSTRFYLIKESFLQFDEFCKYKEGVGYGRYRITNPPRHITAKMFEDFVLYSYQFSSFDSVQKYLQYALDDTIESGKRSIESVPGLYSEVDVNDAKCVLVASLLKLNKFMSWNRMRDNTDFWTEISLNYNKQKDVERIRRREFGAAVHLEAINNYLEIRKLNIREFRDIIVFLLNCDLVCIGYVDANNGDNAKERMRDWLYNRKEVYGTVTDFFQDGNATIFIKYPILYSAILHEITNSLVATGYHVKVSQLLSPEILGGIVETYIRGLYCMQDNMIFSAEYHDKDKNDSEVDIIDKTFYRLIEISIADKPSGDYRFEDVPNADPFSKIRIGKTFSKGRLSYPSFIYALCSNINNFTENYNDGSASHSESSDTWREDVLARMGDIDPMSLYALLPESTKKMFCYDMWKALEYWIDTQETI